jgi:hypothetical protein
MGRVSREARLLFLQLFTLADDSGRLRGNSRMLASLLYPYDEDAGELIDSWLEQLDAENCIRRYTSGGDTYLEILNWLKHQKIDKPSASKLPPFDEHSRIVANAREGSALDQGSRTKGPGSLSRRLRLSARLTTRTMASSLFVIPIHFCPTAGKEEHASRRRKSSSGCSCFTARPSDATLDAIRSRSNVAKRH